MVQLPAIDCSKGGRIFAAARLLAAWVILIAPLGTLACAADDPAPRQGDLIVNDFKFHTGEVMPVLRRALPIPPSDETRGHAQLG
jgi:hypothetical protein